MLITKTTGQQEIFDRNKLCGSLVRSGAPEEVAYRICDAVEKGLTPHMTTQKIWRIALRHLVKEDIRISARYSLRRALANLGPDGFVFERFIEALMQADGYETKRGQMVQGISGITHEVDVLATKGNRTCFIEAKYKNEYGLRTHVDVVMYNYARFQDMKEYAIQKSKNKSMAYEPWVVTNTEFTTSSITYGLFKKMTLVGWDYPEGKTLEDRIAEYKLYPISILPSVTLADRKAFIAQGLVLAQDILLFSVTDLENTVGISPKRSQAIMDEVRGLMKE